MTLHAMPRRGASEPGIVPAFTLGDRLSKALDVAGISVATMAEIQGVGTATVSRWMHDRSPVKRGALTLWAIATGVDQAWLETGTAGLEDQAGGDRYAIRDSNPEPADSVHRHLRAIAGGVNRRLTLDRIQAGEWPEDTPAPLPGSESGGLRLVAGGL